MTLGKSVRYSIRNTTNISKPVYDLVTNLINPSLMESSYDSIWGPVRLLVRISINISL